MEANTTKPWSIVFAIVHKQIKGADDNCRARQGKGFIYCLFVFVALRPMSTAMVIAGRSVHLTTLFPGQA